MNPKPAKDFYKITADQLGISEELVRDAVDMYWKEIRQSMTELKHFSIYAKGIGTFNIRFKKLAELQEKVERKLSYNDGSSFRKMVIKTELENKLSMITIVKEMLIQDRVTKKLIKSKRHDTTNKTDLEKQVVNPGGIGSLNIQEGTGRESISKENEDM